MCLNLLDQIENFKQNRENYSTEERELLAISFREEIAAASKAAQKARGENGASALFF